MQEGGSLVLSAGSKSPAVHQDGTQLQRCTLWRSPTQPAGAEASAVPQRLIQVPGPPLSGDCSAACSLTGAPSTSSLSCPRAHAGQCAPRQGVSTR